MKSYNPFIVEGAKIPLIAYPMEGIEKGFEDRRSLAVKLSSKLSILDLKDEAYALAFPSLGPNEAKLFRFHLYTFPEKGEWTLVNPSSRDRVVVGGWHDQTYPSACETSRIIAGLEGIHRRTATKSIEEYLRTRPSLPESVCNGRDFGTN